MATAFSISSERHWKNGVATKFRSAQLYQDLNPGPIGRQSCTTTTEPPNHRATAAHVYLSMCYSDSVNLDNNAEAWCCCYYNVSSKCGVWVVVGQGMKGGVNSVWARNWKRWDTCLTKLKKVRHMSRPAETHVSPSWKRWDIHQAEKVIETLATWTRRLRGDQIEVFKILNGYENIDSNIFFKIKQSKITRGHNFTLVKKQSRLDVRKFSFSQRTINV